jgi:hypothetical protein
MKKNLSWQRVCFDLPDGDENTPKTRAAIGYGIELMRLLRECAEI